MREVKIHKGTIWFGCAPDGFSYDVGDVLEESVKVTGGTENVLCKPYAIALRVIPRLEPGLIGGLGAQFSPHATDVVTVQVATAKPAESQINSRW
jgi:hypothetical protein